MNELSLKLDSDNVATSDNTDQTVNETVKTSAVKRVLNYLFLTDYEE